MSKKILPHYPFVEPIIAKQLEKKKYDGFYHAVYEKEYNNNWEKIPARLLHTGFGVSIKSIINILTDSKMKEEYYKRPGLFELGSFPIWCMKAPTYDQVSNWIYEKFSIFISIQYNIEIGYFWIVSNEKEKIIIDESIKYYPTPIEALIECIKICLKKYI